MQTSTVRTLVDKALADQETNLNQYITEQREQGKALEEIWIELRELTDIPFALRTLYRWAQIEEAS